MHLIEWLVHFLLLGQISAAILYSMRCFDREECWPVRFITTNYTNFQWYLITMYAVTGQITSRA
ncbi:hypothetical protein C0J52_04267 [Blattella germanica]|nr:hypothetical protein C0J52_04267 [Blattella germanica]